MKTIFTLILLVGCIHLQRSHSQNAPVTITGNHSSSESTVTVPVTAEEFINIASCNLKLIYDPTVATATAVTIGPALGGYVSANLAIAGEINLGWYNFMGVTLPDHSVIFNITFTKTGSGTTPLVWSDDGYSCIYYDAFFNALNDIPTTSYFVNGTLSFTSQNAPVTTISSITSPGGMVTVPVTTCGFNDVISYNLRITYDPSIMMATMVTANGLPGGALDANLAIPGVITLGWYNVAGVTLPAGSQLFSITFLKMGCGMSTVAFADDGYSCIYYNASYYALNDTPTANYYHPGSVTFQSTEAPVTIAPMVTAYPGSQIFLPVKVAGFSNIGSVSLTLNYDPSVLAFQSLIPNSGFPQLFYGGNIPGTVVIGGYTDPSGPALTFPDSTVLCTLVFDYFGGISSLVWNDDGGSCEYADHPSFQPLIDIPFQQHYINGQVAQSAQLVPPATVAQEQEIMAGQTVCYNATGIVTVAGNGTTFIVHDGGSATMVAGEKIMYLPGTLVRAGGYLHGYIESGNQFCGAMVPSMPSSGGAMTADADKDKQGVKVFPNPAPGCFTIEGLGQSGHSRTTVELFSMCGERKLRVSVDNAKQYKVNLPGYSPGLYFLKVTEGNDAKTIKIQLINR